jgi:hypothetical protein
MLIILFRFITKTFCNPLSQKKIFKWQPKPLATSIASRLIKLVTDEEKSVFDLTSCLHMIL